MKYNCLRNAILLVGIFCLIFFCRAMSISADTYEKGRIVVEHKELPVKRNGRNIVFNHPSELQGNVIANVLSNIYYEERGLFKKKGPLRVFQDDEIATLTPLIIQALSVATPKQAVTVLSYSERAIFSDQQNYFIVFVCDHRLNVAFSRVHMFQTYNDTVKSKKRYPRAKENPALISHSRFWNLIPSAGQQMEPDHKNWLVLDLADEIYQQPIVSGDELPGKKGVIADSDGRREKLEDRLGGGCVYTRQTKTSPVREMPNESKIKRKLILLRELVDDGIILKEDYDYKKAKLLREGMSDMSIKDQLRELKELESEGLITEEDYSEKKKALLDQF